MNTKITTDLYSNYCLTLFQIIEEGKAPMIKEELSKDLGPMHDRYESDVTNYKLYKDMANFLYKSHKNLGSDFSNSLKVIYYSFRFTSRLDNLDNWNMNEYDISIGFGSQLFALLKGDHYVKLINSFTEFINSIDSLNQRNFDDMIDKSIKGMNKNSNKK